jgi:hypothetical protein
MANFRIDQLQSLSPANFDPSSDVLIVQKPNGGTFKMTPGNVVTNTVSVGLKFLSKSYFVESFGGTGGSWQNSSFSVDSANVPDTASAAFLSIDNSGDDDPAFGFRFFTSSNYSINNMHELKYLNLSSSDQQSVTTCFVPIVNGVIYYSLYNFPHSANSKLDVYMHAYM